MVPAGSSARWVTRHPECVLGLGPWPLYPCLACMCPVAGALAPHLVAWTEFPHPRCHRETPAPTLSSLPWRPQCPILTARMPGSPLSPLWELWSAPQSLLLWRPQPPPSLPVGTPAPCPLSPGQCFGGWGNGLRPEPEESCACALGGGLLLLPATWVARGPGAVSSLTAPGGSKRGR